MILCKIHKKINENDITDKMCWIEDESYPHG